MSKQDQNSIVQPSEAELTVYKQLIVDIPENQLDELANEYFEEVSKNELAISFPRFVIDKMVRPIQPGDTISFQTAEDATVYLFCLVRKEVEGVSYLLFAQANGETEELNTEVTYLFFVDGKDDIGTEIIDIVPAGELSEKVLDAMEADQDVQILGEAPKAE
jgi:hypothetical protein